MDDPFLVGVLYGLADRDELLQSRPHRKPLAIAVIGDRHAAHQFHDEVRAARVA